MSGIYPTVAGVEFRDVVGYPGYCVGDDGSAWSSWIRGNNARPGGPWKQLSPRPAANGYHYVGLYRDGRQWRVQLHRLILEAFAGPCPDMMECRHLNGIKS